VLICEANYIPEGSPSMRSILTLPLPDSLRHLPRKPCPKLEWS